MTKPDRMQILRDIQANGGRIIVPEFELPEIIDDLEFGGLVRVNFDGPHGYEVDVTLTDSGRRLLGVPSKPRGIRESFALIVARVCRAFS